MHSSPRLVRPHYSSKAEAGEEFDTHVRQLIKWIENPKQGFCPLPGGVFAVSDNGLPLFKGDILLDLKTVHGFPIEFALISIFQHGWQVDWIEFVNYARYRGFLVYQIMEMVEVSLRDAFVERNVVEKILDNIRLFICITDEDFRHYIKTDSLAAREMVDGLVRKYGPTYTPPCGPVMLHGFGTRTEIKK
jgi:hypothetical protein